MANCSSCGEKLGFEYRAQINNKYFCKTCEVTYRIEKLETKQAEAGNAQKIEAIVLTTETAPNLNIKSRVGIIMADADCVFDVAMVKNKDALLSNLKSEAHTIGANAVVGVTFNMIETYSASLGIGKVNTFKLLAYGTAVIIETEEGAL
tara:strand:+ start:593 stop:1039 length:447 start_codon:yes stop_codon:yes gene_type:complete